MPKAPPRLDPDDPVQGLALEMRSLRRRAGNPSLTLLARAMSCSHATVSAYLNGRRLPSPDQLNKFVQACKGDPAILQSKLEDVQERLSRLVPSSQSDPGSGAEKLPDRASASALSPEEGKPDSGGKPRAAAVVTLQVTKFSQARTIGELFREGSTLVLNLTQMSDDDAMRVIDFSAGLVFGLRGIIDRVAAKVLVLYPAGVAAEIRQQANADASVVLESGPLDEVAKVPVRRQLPGASIPTPVPPELLPVIKVVGVGGCGVSTVNRMLEIRSTGIQVIAIDTDAVALLKSEPDVKLWVGQELARGAGGGGDPEIGKQAIENYRAEIEEALRGADMVFVAAGQGGGTGTGGAPVVASIARELGALTIGVVIRPFGFEGTRRTEQAKRGIERLRNEVDTLLVIPNDRLLSISDRHVSVLDAFKAADQVLLASIVGITDLLTLPGLINLGFGAVRLTLSNAGSALIGIGSGRGGDRAVFAAEMAISSPLLDVGIDGARNVLLSIQGGSDLGLFEVNEAVQLVSNSAATDANILIGAVIDDTLGDEVRVMVIAAGFEADTSHAEGNGGT